MNENKIEALIFDLGGVLLDWNPEYLYSKIFENDREKMNWFLENICTTDWNMEQDAGRSFKEGTDFLVDQYPEYETPIRAFYVRWNEMLKGEIKDTALILNKLKELNKVNLYGLTNWSVETFPIAEARFTCLKLFQGIVVSGMENTRKPFPEIYRILLNRYHLEAEKCLFIDDNQDNVDTARQLGMVSIHFKSPDQLNQELVQLGIL